MGKLIRAVLRGGDSGNTVSLTRPLALVPREGKADLVTFCEEMAPDARKKRRLQRKMDRQRRANNPENYDEQGRIKKVACVGKRASGTRRPGDSTPIRNAGWPLIA